MIQCKEGEAADEAGLRPGDIIVGMRAESDADDFPVCLLGHFFFSKYCDTLLRRRSCTILIFPPVVFRHFITQNNPLALQIGLKDDFRTFLKSLGNNAPFPTLYVRVCQPVTTPFVKKQTSHTHLSSQLADGSVLTLVPGVSERAVKGKVWKPTPYTQTSLSLSLSGRHSLSNAFAESFVFPAKNFPPFPQLKTTVIIQLIDRKKKGQTSRKILKKVEHY